MFVYLLLARNARFRRTSLIKLFNSSEKRLAEVSVAPRAAQQGKQDRETIIPKISPGDFTK